MLNIVQSMMWSDIYSPTLGLSPLVDGLFTRLRRKVHEELVFQQELTAIRGALEMVFAASQSKGILG